MLTPKRQRFIAEYLIDLNAKQAAIRAGYSVKTAERQSSRLLTYPDVRSAVEQGKAKQLEAADVSAGRVLEEMRRLAFCDIRTFFDEHGNLKPIAQLTAEQGSALASMEVIIKNTEAGDGKTHRVHKFKVITLHFAGTAGCCWTSPPKPKTARLSSPRE